MAAGAPEGAPRRPWRRGHDGARRNLGYDAVEAKVKRASRSGAHHDHAGVLGEDGDGLERRGHGEVGGSGASAGSKEEDAVGWHWTARGEASRPRSSGRARRSCWQMQSA